MANVLQTIVADKRKELAARKQDMPLDSFIDGLTPSPRSFYDALATPEAGYILECKKASPSKGLIREPFDLDEIIAAYQPYAACISVLTDEKYFQGHYDYLNYVSQRVQQPVLNKDFFIDPYQVHLARHYNADAILLMLSVLNDDEYRQLAQLADQYQLDVLTEVSNEAEADRAVALGARIIGINNRNLRDLSTDLSTTERLAPRLRKAGFDGLIISESGIYTQADVRRLGPLSDGFLVGSALMAQPDLASTVRQLVQGTVKVCGLTRVEDALLAEQLGASYGGLIFVDGSPRCVTVEQARTIAQATSMPLVGVFRNAPVANVIEQVKQASLRVVQLHGDENQHYVDTLRKALPANCQIWKAQGVDDTLTLPSLHGIDLWLLDTQVGQHSGGTGKTFDWTLLNGLNSKVPVGLAGGLSPENIEQAANTGVHLLDVNSGVESAPGIKSAARLRELFSALRHY
ncbi:bifunctional indole-3-glycerol-phosphate synthase TrpC/phosphoribosylanthranilate isomerase TrpF [Aestuariibacter halophilus]|uniref:Multifunctional fusion protein n=1 Tax=Fluctibacter halophilus TaxID=226011 RepID=A0ABS8G570_9ALTE|nr:bifunctional indole-3-glycerol-phosphate synthase TrpC/phosphoribosylanthranilate isomerase TrpF [Aestuariibacter halophilus]MCC2615261.1 bifunctional indole-3-glycerol-phosphate synthase TrpC/phosphoribosylanthranilate isomerase TrpF [Aestuariibacter halophilus]